MAMEVYRGTSGKTAAIYKCGQININCEASTEFGLTEGQRVLLAFDKDTSEIGIKKCEDGEYGTLSVNLNNGSCIINASKFLRYFKIDPQKIKGKRFPFRVKDGMITFCIKE